MLLVVTSEMARRDQREEPDRQAKSLRGGPPVTVGRAEHAPFHGRLCAEQRGGLLDRSRGPERIDRLPGRAAPGLGDPGSGLTEVVQVYRAVRRPGCGQGDGLRQQTDRFFQVSLLIPDGQRRGQVGQSDGLAWAVLIDLLPRLAFGLDAAVEGVTVGCVQELYVRGSP